MRPVLLLFLLLPAITCAQLRGTATRVHDGDTFTMLTTTGRKLTIRLAGIDCPELAQPYGKEARQYSTRILLYHTITIDSTGADRYGRIIATVYTNKGQNLNELLLQKGYAWHYVHYDSSPRLADIQTGAQQTRAGLWQQTTPIPPWQYRFHKRFPNRKYNFELAQQYGLA